MVRGKKAFILYPPFKYGSRQHVETPGETHDVFVLLCIATAAADRCQEAAKAGIQ